MNIPILCTGLQGTIKVGCHKILTHLFYCFHIFRILSLEIKVMWWASLGD